jgi:hypothetical protein
MNTDLTSIVDVPYERISSELVNNAVVGVVPALGYARPLEAVVGNIKAVEDHEEESLPKSKKKGGKRGNGSQTSRLNEIETGSLVRPINTPRMIDDEDETISSQIPSGKPKGNQRVVNPHTNKPEIEQPKEFDPYEEPELNIDLDLAKAIDDLAKTLAKKEDEEENEDDQSNIAI